MDECNSDAYSVNKISQLPSSDVD